MYGPKFMGWEKAINRSFEIFFLTFIVGFVGGVIIGFGTGFEDENLQLVFFLLGGTILTLASISASIKIIADSVSYALYYSNQNKTSIVSSTNYVARNQSQATSSNKSQAIPQFGETS